MDVFLYTLAAMCAVGGTTSLIAVLWPRRIPRGRSVDDIVGRIAREQDLT